MKSIVKIVPGKSIQRMENCSVPNNALGLFYSPKRKSVAFYCKDGSVGFIKKDETFIMANRRMEVDDPVGMNCDKWGIVVLQLKNDMLWKFDQEYDSGSRLCGTSAYVSMKIPLSNPQPPPYGLCRTGRDSVFFAIPGAHLVAKVTSGVYSWKIGSGKKGFMSSSTSSASLLDSPRGVCFDEGTKTIFVSDSGNRIVRAFRNGKEVAFIGMPGADGFVDGIATAARFRNPTISCCDHGTVAICDDNLVRTIGASSLEVNTPYASSNAIIGLTAWDGVIYALENI